MRRKNLYVTGLLLAIAVGLCLSSPVRAIGGKVVADWYVLYNSFNVKGSAAPAVSFAGEALVYHDSTTNTLRASENGGAYSNVALAGKNNSFSTSQTMAGATINGTATVSDAAGTGAGTVTSVAGQDINIATAGAGTLQIARNATVTAANALTVNNITSTLGTDMSIRIPPRATDAAPDKLTIQGGHAYAQASAANEAGANVVIWPGTGVRAVKVLLLTTGKAVTVYVDQTATTKTEGVNFTVGATVAATATAMATAFAGVSGITAAAVTDTVYFQPTSTTKTVFLTSTDETVYSTTAVFGYSGHVEIGSGAQHDGRGVALVTRGGSSNTIVMENNENAANQKCWQLYANNYTTGEFELNYVDDDFITNPQTVMKATRDGYLHFGSTGNYQSNAVIIVDAANNLAGKMTTANLKFQIGGGSDQALALMGDGATTYFSTQGGLAFNGSVMQVRGNANSQARVLISSGSGVNPFLSMEGANNTAGKKLMDIYTSGDAMVWRNVNETTGAENTAVQMALNWDGALGIGTNSFGSVAGPMVTLKNIGTEPGAIADQTSVFAKDYAAGDSRAQVQGEAGTALWLGNGTVESDAPAAGAGNDLTLAPSAAASGDTNGGNVVLQQKAGSGAGLPGYVRVQTPANAASLNMKSTSTTATMSAATVTLSNFIPADAFITGLVARVTTVLDAGTGIDIGVSGDTARFVDDMATTLNATGNSYKLATPLAPYMSAAATDLVLTTAGGPPASGVVRVTLFYFDLTEPGS